MSAPLSEQQLAEIRARWQFIPRDEEYRLTVTNTSHPGTTLTALEHAREDTPALLAEVARLQAERHERNEALDDAVKAIREKDELLAEFEAERDKLVRWHAEDTKRIGELEARIERRRMRLVEADADLLEMRGLLSPNGRPRRIPPEVEIHERVAPAVEWLLGRVVELEREAAAAKTPQSSAPAAAPARRAVSADSFAARLARVLHRQYTDVVTAKPVDATTLDATTLDLTVQPADLARWEWWLIRISAPTGQTTLRGSYATAKGQFGRTRVLLTGVGVGALYAAERDRVGGESS